MLHLNGIDGRHAAQMSMAMAMQLKIIAIKLQEQ